MTNKKTIRKSSRAPSPAIEPPSIDWSLIIRDMLEAGCSKYRIAASLGVHVSHVQHWAQTHTDIRYGYGRALLRMHAHICGAALTTQRITEGENSAYTSPA